MAVAARQSGMAALAGVLIAAVTGTAGMNAAARAGDVIRTAGMNAAARAGDFDLLVAQEAFDPDDLPPRAPDADLLERRPRERRAPSSATRAGRSSLDERRAKTSPKPSMPHVEHEESVIYEPTEGDAFSWLVSSGTQLHRGYWYTALDAVLMHRSTAPRQNLSFLGTSTAQSGVIPISILMDTETDGFEYEPGMRLTVGRYLGRDNRNRDHVWDVSFLGLNDWESSAAVNVDPASGQFLLLPQDGSVAGFNFAEVHSYTYSSDLNSFETNYKLRFRLGRDRLILTPEGEWQRECTPGFTPAFFGGVRVISADENFAFTSLGLDFNPNDADPPESARYEIRTNNDLVGMQIGAEVYEQHCNWGFGVRAKLGGLVNFASQESHLQITTQQDIEFPAFREASTTQMAMLAELGLVGSYHIKPNIALRASYDFLWLQGMALGPQQLQYNFTAPPEIVSGNHVFYDGASVGLEIVW